MNFRKVSTVFLAMGLCIGLGSCASSSENMDSEETQKVSDAGSAAVSDSGQDSPPNEDPRASMPESVKAIKAPQKEDYPNLGGNDEEGAEALAKFFTDSYMYAYSIADSSILTDNFDLSDCEKCKIIVEKLDDNLTQKLYSDHGTADEVILLDFLGYKEDGNGLVNYKFYLGPYTDYTDSKAVRISSGEEVFAQISLSKKDDVWLINDFSMVG